MSIFYKTIFSFQVTFRSSENYQHFARFSKNAINITESFCSYFEEPQLCSDPGSIPNAGRNPPTGTQTQFSTGSQIFYNCNNCYRGGGSITCQSGTWLPTQQPTCSRKYFTLRKTCIAISQMSIVFPFYLK